MKVKPIYEAMKILSNERQVIQFIINQFEQEEMTKEDFLKRIKTIYTNTNDILIEK